MFKHFFIERKSGFGIRILKWVTFLSAFALLLSYLSCYINPAGFWPLAFFGLAYPIFLLLNLILTLILSLYRNKWVLVPIFVFIIGFNHFRHFYQISFQTSPTNPDQPGLKVMSWNVRLFDLYNYNDHSTVRYGIFDVLKREQPAILCFQEFFYSGEKNFFETRDTLIQFLPCKYVAEAYTHHLERKDQYFGLAIFSQYPIIKHGKIDFPNEKNNNAMFADLNINNDTIRIYNTHLSSIKFQRGDYEYIGDTTNANRWLHPWQKPAPAEQKILSRLKTAFVKRSEQTKILKQHIEQSPYPVILCGDFNDTPISWCYRQFNSILTDAFVESGNGIGNTYIGKFPSFRIDYIFHSPELGSYGFQTHPEKLSDHHAVSAFIETGRP